jgi:hypothetical protein
MWIVASVILLFGALLFAGFVQDCRDMDRENHDDPANTDYQQYLLWLAEGNEPLPALDGSSEE